MKTVTTTRHTKNLAQQRPLTDTPYTARVVQTVFHSSGRPPGGKTVSTSLLLTNVANTDRVVYLKTQARADFFNIFNHPNFGQPDKNLTDPLFGQSTQMLASSLAGLDNAGFNPLYQIGGPRSIQLALKLQF